LKGNCRLQNANWHGGEGELAMKIPVRVVTVPGNKFEARAGEPFSFTAEGASRDEALRRLREKISGSIAAGEVVSLDVPGDEHPWEPFAGTLRDEQLFNDWQQAIADRRREVDSDPDAP
jgi:hypothetical protein